MRAPLALEIALARGAARLSRLAGAGGGTTLPGKLLWKLDPGAVDRLAERLPRGSAVISATNGKTTTAAMAARILEPSVRLAHNRAGANLVSGVASALVAARDAELGLFEVDEAALPEVAGRLSPRAVSLGNLFRDQLDRYGELELVAQRWRAMARALPAGSVLVANADDPQLGAIASERPGSVVFGLDDPRHASPELQHAADSKWCVRCGTPYEYAAAYIGHLGDYRCPSCGHARPPLDVAAREIELHGLESVSFSLDTPDGSTRASLEEIESGLQGFSAAFGRFERIQLDERSLLVLLIKNPAGANEIVRTLVAGGAPGLLLVALNDEIADGRDVSWIWDVDFEPLLGSLRRLIATGERATELALRFKYAGFAEDAIEVVPSLEDALDRGLELTPAGGELTALPTYTAMLALRDLVARRGFVKPYWEQAA